MSPSLQELGIDRLNAVDRLDLIAAIWDSLADDLESLPVPEWHRRELDRRFAAREADPSGGATWEEVKARLRGRR